MISFAMVPAYRVLDTGEISAGAPGGFMSASLDVEQPVLQGFKLDFDSDDHHLNRVGARLDPGEVTVWYDDKNHDDDFDWTVWWVDMR
jgi:hypothetical protein